jgi:hypothetical protein
MASRDGIHVFAHFVVVASIWFNGPTARSPRLRHERDCGGRWSEAMCGRYGRSSRRQRVEELLGIEPSGLDNFPDLYNITAGVETWIARAKGGKPTLYSCLWGLVPYWSKDPKKGRGLSTPERRPRGKADVQEADP